MGLWDDFRGVLFGFRNFGDFRLKFADGLRKKRGNGSGEVAKTEFFYISGYVS